MVSEGLTIWNIGAIFVARKPTHTEELREDAPFMGWRTKKQTTHNKLYLFTLNKHL